MDIVLSFPDNVPEVGSLPDLIASQKRLLGPQDVVSTFEVAIGLRSADRIERQL